jgi:hypothetical protein
MPSNFESMSTKEKTNAFNKFTIDEECIYEKLKRSNKSK